MGSTGCRCDGLEGFPGSVLVFWVARQTVGVEEGFDCFYCKKLSRKCINRAEVEMEGNETKRRMNKRGGGIGYGIWE